MLCNNRDLKLSIFRKIHKYFEFECSCIYLFYIYRDIGRKKIHAYSVRFRIVAEMSQIMATQYHILKCECLNTWVFLP